MVRWQCALQAARASSLSRSEMELHNSLDHVSKVIYGEMECNSFNEGRGEMEGRLFLFNNHPPTKNVHENDICLMMDQC